MTVVATASNPASPSVGWTSSGGKTYTIDTLRDLRAQHPDADLFFITGADASPRSCPGRTPRTFSTSPSSSASPTQVRRLSEDGLPLTGSTCRRCPPWPSRPPIAVIVAAGTGLVPSSRMASSSTSNNYGLYRPEGCDRHRPPSTWPVPPLPRPPTSCPPPSSASTSLEHRLSPTSLSSCRPSPNDGGQRHRRRGSGDVLRDLRFKPLRREASARVGGCSSTSGDIVVHVQHDEERAFYELERLWKDCPALDLGAVGTEQGGR